MRKPIAKICKSCGLSKPAKEFYDARDTRDGLMAVCRKCHNTRLTELRRTSKHSRMSATLAVRRYRRKNGAKLRKKDQTYYKNRGGKAKSDEWRHANVQKVRDINKRSRQRHPERTKARHAVRAALRRGDLAKPRKCQECGKVTKKLDGHHHNGYDEEHWLDVVWLCEECHGKTERIDP